MDELTRCLLLALAPPKDREWIAAMLAETQSLADGERLLWHVGAGRVALAMRIRHWAPTLEASALAVLMIAVDWASGALLPALILIAASAAILTRASRGSAAALMVTAGILPLAHALANWLPQLRPHYQYAALDLRDWCILAAVGAIGICAVQVASALWDLWDETRAQC